MQADHNTISSMVEILEFRHGKISNYTHMRKLLKEEFSAGISEEELIFWDTSRIAQQDKSLIYKHYGY